MANVLCIVAHADDETLGCGGTLLRHRAMGDTLGIIVTADGVSSRTHDSSQTVNTELNLRLQQALAAFDLLGIRWQQFLNYPDNCLDQVPLLDIVKSYERLIAEFQPDIIYTHNGTDLNIDHRQVHQAVMTACRPLPGSRLNTILAFEVLSSTEWQSSSSHKPFLPSYFVNISDYLSQKLEVLRCYENELKDYPHSRSLSAVESLARVRGSSVGVGGAEAFMVERMVVF